jgi:hypothetical protein
MSMPASTRLACPRDLRGETALRLEGVSRLPKISPCLTPCGRQNQKARSPPKGLPVLATLALLAFGLAPQSRLSPVQSQGIRR